MTDIVERLRVAAPLPTGLYCEAADVIDALRQQLFEEHEAHLIAEEQWIARHEVALEAAHYEAVKVVALKRELTAETKNKQQFERDWLECCDALTTAQARNKALRDALFELANLHVVIHSQSPEGRAYMKKLGDLMASTDDTALKAALANERERCAKVCELVVKNLEVAGRRSFQAMACRDAIRALGNE